MADIKVQKKDGTLQDFDRGKVNDGVVKAGASFDQAQSVATQVENWAQGAAVDGVIKSSDIRTKIVELLQPANPNAAAKFRAYRKEA
ncbi:MAG TPA: ATP cone domain-containing protein [Nevskiaceae bacterium]|nr:ATP cone domain-containing protein [Nevskiaceae bacterium]